jgi:hypothetical protein
MPNNPQITITVDASGNPQVSSNSARVSKGGGNQVLFQNQSGQTATVSFVVSGSATKTTSPFSNNSISINSNATQGTGPVKSGANAGGTEYPYSVTVGSKTLDPVVIVDN